MKQPNSTPLQPSPLYGQQQRKVEKSTVVLYLLFFLIWMAGYLFGILENTTAILCGIPLWFAISCLMAFAVVTVTLAFILKRESHDDTH